VGTATAEATLIKLGSRDGVLAAGALPGGAGLWDRVAGEDVEAEAVAAGRDGGDDPVEELPPGSFGVDWLPNNHQRWTQA
jgi:hypothetical protein